MGKQAKQEPKKAEPPKQEPAKAGPQYICRDCGLDCGNPAALGIHRRTTGHGPKPKAPAPVTPPASGAAPAAPRHNGGASRVNYCPICGGDLRRVASALAER